MRKNKEVAKPEDKIKLGSNQPHNILKNGDLLGVSTKASFFVELLTHDFRYLNDNKMFAIYGPWGSGKTSFIELIQQSLEENFKIVTVKLETWEHELDGNLATSLLSLMVSKLKSNWLQKHKSLLYDLDKILRAAFKASTLNFGTYKFQGKDFHESLENDMSFYEKRENIRKAFRKIEQELIDSSKGDRVVVFIDDLDRCSPENVLSLITTIKLFFTLTSRTLFVFGLDKTAVEESVKLKYGKVIDPSVYLEKIFDISFNMPKSKNLKNLLYSFFFSDLIGAHNCDFVIDRLDSFFTALGFTNPRHIKKIMNKLFFLSSLETYIDEDVSVGYNVEIINGIWSPNQVRTNKVCENLVLLFLIIMHDYHNEIFQEMRDLEGKVSNYLDIVSNTGGQNAKNQLINFIQQAQFDQKDTYDKKGVRFVDLKQKIQHRENRSHVDQAIHKERMRFSGLFLPYINGTLNTTDYDSLLKSFDNNRSRLCVSFIKYMISNNLLESECEVVISDLYGRVELYS